MAEKVDPTWIAYAFPRAVDAERLESALARVEAHYGSLVSYPLKVQRTPAARLGVAVIGDAEPNCAWRHFAGGDGVTLASAYVPTGWERITGPLPPGEAPLPLARALLAEPARAAESLTPPSVLAVMDAGAERLVVVNDCIGAGRLFETAVGDGRVWSNRAAAGRLLAGEPVEADERGWQLLAAAGWFIADSTPFAGVRRVPRGTVIDLTLAGIEVRDTGAVGRLVGRNSQAVADLYDGAAEQAVEQVRTADALWSERPAIHLSGGRDSRLVAAAAVAGEVDATFRTSDNAPGEADVARRLVELAPRPMEHNVVNTEEGGTPEAPLLERALRGQLLHDAIRHASKVRNDVNLPRGRPARATLAGWGGEIGHAFYYQDGTQLRRLKLRGRKRALTRLLQSSRKKHDAAHESAYELAGSEYDSLLREGEGYGLRGPSLLDWAYLTERFVHRFEIGADSQGVSVFAAPAFIRLAFALKPEQRLTAEAHSELTGRLVPAWRDVPYYKRPPGPRPKLRRRRLWEAEEDARTLEELIAGGGWWTELFRRDRITEMWEDVRSGGGYADWETVFERLAFCAAFDGYRATIDQRADLGPPLFG